MDQEGWTALHFAVRNCDTNLVEKLIEKGASVTQENNDRVTALQLAEKTGNQEIVEMLGDRTRTGRMSR